MTTTIKAKTEQLLNIIYLKETYNLYEQESFMQLRR